MFAAVHNFNKELLYEWHRRFDEFGKFHLSTFLPSLVIFLAKSFVATGKSLDIATTESGWSSRHRILSSELETLTYSAFQTPLINIS